MAGVVGAALVVEGGCRCAGSAFRSRGYECARQCRGRGRGAWLRLSGWSGGTRVMCCGALSGSVGRGWGVCVVGELVGGFGRMGRVGLRLWFGCGGRSARSGRFFRGVVGGGVVGVGEFVVGRRWPAVVVGLGGGGLVQLGVCGCGFFVLGLVVARLEGSFAGSCPAFFVGGWPVRVCFPDDVVPGVGRPWVYRVLRFPVWVGSGGMLDELRFRGRGFGEWVGADLAGGCWVVVAAGCGRGVLAGRTQVLFGHGMRGRWRRFSGCVVPGGSVPGHFAVGFVDLGSPPLHP